MKYTYLSVIGLLLSLQDVNADQSRAIITSIDRTVLSSQIAGQIIDIPKNDGDYFKKNDILVKIDCDIYQAQKEKAEAAQELAKIKLLKNKELEKYNSVGKFDVATAELEYKQEEIEATIAALNVQRCVIKAPYDGRVIERKASRFQTIKPQDELIEIVNSDSYEAKVIAPSSWLSFLKIGTSFTLYVDELKANVRAKVKQIDSIVDARSQTISFRATIESSKVLAGMSATAKF